MAFDDWPPLSVRSWSQVLAMRDPSWGSQAEDYDDITGAGPSGSAEGGLMSGRVGLLALPVTVVRRSSPGSLRSSACGHPGRAD